MGETYIVVQIRAESSKKRGEIRLLVDTGATYSWISRRDLEKLDVKPVRKVRFRTMNGSMVEREVGYVFVKYEEEEAPTVSVFADEGDGKVFGLHGLESLGLEVDAATHTVRKSEALLAL